MSYLIVDEVLKAGARDLGLTGTQQHVLISLAHFANDKSGRKAWPTLETLGAMTGYSRATIARAIGILAAKGLVVEEGSQRKFRCHIPHLAGDRVPHPDSLNVSPCTTEGSHPDPLNESPCNTGVSPRDTQCLTMTHEPVKNQIHNQKGNLSPFGRAPVDLSMPCTNDHDWTYSTLGEHLQTRILAEMRSNGYARASVRVNERGLAKQLRRISDETELDLEDLHELMHLYAKSSTTWPTTTHPVWGFIAGGTIERLRNISSRLVVDTYDPADDSFFAGSVMAKSWLARLEGGDDSATG